MLAAFGAAGLVCAQHLHSGTIGGFVPMACSAVGWELLRSRTNQALLPRSLRGLQASWSICALVGGYHPQFQPPPIRCHRDSSSTRANAFNPSAGLQFEEIWSKYDKGGKGGLTLQEIQVGLMLGAVWWMLLCYVMLFTHLTGWLC